MGRPHTVRPAPAGSRPARRAFVLCSRRSRLPRPEPRAGLGQFVLRCLYSHSLPDDPIVVPGTAGRVASARLLRQSVDRRVLDDGDDACRRDDLPGPERHRRLLGAGRVPERGPDPTDRDADLLPGVSRAPGSRPSRPGSEMVAGNRDATSGESENPHVAGRAGRRKDVRTPRSPTPTTARRGPSSTGSSTGIIAVDRLPELLERHRDHAGHRRLSGQRALPGPIHPRAAPHLRARALRDHEPRPTPTARVALTLSSGPYWTYHADFWNTWQQARLDQLVSECLVARVHCGAVDASGEVDWTSEFGTTRYDLAIRGRERRRRSSTWPGSPTSPCPGSDTTTATTRSCAGTRPTAP